VSLTAGPLSWAAQSVAAYHKWHANAIIAEKNHGGEMVESTLATVDKDAAVQTVWASQGKAARAEPVVAKYQKGLVHHVGHFGELEEQMTNWYHESGLPSPDRLDAMVWAMHALMLGPGPAPLVGVGGATQTSHWRS
jgi:phage terminase large subunit-like protein